MDSNQLFKYVKAKYGLKFEPAIAGSTNLYLLMSPLDSSYFAMLSRVKDKMLGKSIAVLDLKCGDFAQTIRDLPGFTTALRVKSADWVGAYLENNRHEAAIKKALDYAFKLAMNDKNTNLAQSQYLYIPENDGEKQYQAQVIKQRPRSAKKGAMVPAPIKQMLEIYDYSILPSQGRQKNFYHQGKLMANYTDDYDDFFAFKRFYPTYHDMTVGQLRSYFAWRSKLRKGKYEKTSTSYAFVYIYELLNNIGVEEQEGFQKLIEFEEKYVKKFDPSIEPYLENWLKDYVLFYQIDQIKNVFAKEIKEDQNYIILHHPENFTANDLANVIAQKSSYWDKSKAIAQNKQLFTQILYYAWQEILNAKKYGIAYYSNFVAKTQIKRQSVFAGSVFYLRRHESFSVQIDPVRKYRFSHDQWQIESDQALAKQKTNLNNFVHELDRLVRINFNLGRPIKPRFVDSAVIKAIQAGIAIFQKQEKKQQIDQVKIDFSNLASIRANASKTRESLLTDEEKQLEQEEQSPAVLKNEANELQNIDNDYGLDKNELFLLLALLKKEDWQEFVREKHLLVAILVDSINEKLFDEFGDAVIEFNEQDQPQIIDDYADELKELFIKG